MQHGGRPEPESETSPNTTWRNFTEPGSSDSATTAELANGDSRGTASTFHDSVIQSEPSPDNGQVRILRKLEKEIESFRVNQSSKTTMIASILRILEEVSDVEITQSQKDSTFDSYLTEILAIESARENLQNVGPANEHPTTESINQSSNRSKQITRNHKESVGSDSDDEEDKPAKKPKLLESDMPWYESPDVSSTNRSDPSCGETCRLLRAYNLDVSKAKFFIKIAPRSPPGIPSSQWERILKGEAVDLNQIFSSLHHVITDEERTGRLGETEITFGVTEPKRRISTAAEWSVAWRKASKAIAFAFPHRREELFEYGDYIESEFAAKVSSSHHKILLYDTALRNEVAAGQHFLLTDHKRFSRLYSAIVMPDGIEGNSDGTIPRKPPKNKGKDKVELCNKFNAGTCKKQDGECKYRHLCKGCGRTGHGSKDCPDGAK